MKYPQNVLDAVEKQLSGGAKAKKPAAKGRGARYQVGPKEKRTSDGIVFDSVFERETYDLLKKFVGLAHVTLQQKFELQPGFRFEGKWHRPITYKADFTIHTADGDLVVDTKGHHTDTFRMKEKMFIYKFKKPLLLLHTKKSVMRFIADLQAMTLVTKPDENN